MRVATGGNYLNFGYWENGIKDPKKAQEKMCDVVAKLGEFSSNQKIIDLGSGFGDPASFWSSKYPDLHLTCININYNQLIISNDLHCSGLNFLNSTATALPISSDSVERVVALESAQHFKPLNNFISESFRILKPEGILILAIPVMTQKSSALVKLGTLSMTWSSEHYSVDLVKSIIEEAGFTTDIQNIGSFVYEPLANYYFENRNSVKEKIETQYPSYVEKILFNSLKKMKNASEKRIIDYLLIVCHK